MKGMVVCPEPLAAEAGAWALRKGGNAFDAAIAGAFAQGVVDPVMCGIGGHGRERARAYCSFSFCVYIWWGRVGDRIRSGLLCLRAAIAITYEAITHNVTWMIAFSNPLVCSWFKP